MNKLQRIELVCIIILTGLLVVFFGSRKLEYHEDEVWNYGLANHIGGIYPDVEYGKVYTGMGPFESFMEVQSGKQFDYKNVFENQKMDVHPPLYYCFLHTVCSMFPDSYSIWYAVAINLFWMIFISILIYKLTYNITKNPNFSLGILLAYETTIVALDTFLYLRMYTQFTFFTIALAYLINKYWDRKLDVKFYVPFSVIIIGGLLTHYYFMIFAFAICVCFAIKLLMEKRTKEIINCVITTACDVAIYLLIWSTILDHIFGGYRGKEAGGKVVSLDGLINLVEMMFITSTDTFTLLSAVFGILMLVLFIKRIKQKKNVFDYRFALLYAGIFDFIVVGQISPFYASRYVSPVMFIFVITSIIAVSSYMGERIGDRKKARILVIAACLIFNVIGYAVGGFHINNDFYLPDRAEVLSYIEDKDCVVYLGEDWEITKYLGTMNHAKSVVFINKDNVDMLSDYEKTGYVLVTMPEYAEEIIPGMDTKVLFEHNGLMKYFEFL